MSALEYHRFLVDYAALRYFGIDAEDESGMAGTEIAIYTFILAAAAAIVGGIIFAAARDNANNIPTQVPAPG